MAAQLQILGHDMDVDEKLNDLVAKKVAKLDRYLSGIQETRVDLKHYETVRQETDRYAAQITVHGKGYTLRTEERTDDIRSALDSALDKMQRRIETYKGKRFSVRGDGTSVSDTAMEALEADYEETQTPEIARRKKFMLTPMDEAEAMEQMKLLGHEDFFVFYNMQHGAVSVLYKRRDGSYGLIDTELA